MEVDSQDARLLLTSAMEEPADMSDSDDCQSGDEEILQDQLAKVTAKAKLRKAERRKEKEEEEDDDYHKMKEVEDRPYQKELLEMAKRQNIIICLPTGSGKTYIALELTRYMLSDAIEKKQKIIFLANNVPLVNQQAKYFSQNLASTIVKDDQVVRAITGDLNVDIWSQEQWNEVLNACHIMVVSTQIVLDGITKGFIKWDQIALLILDECHHAQKKHPMAVLMGLYGERLLLHGFSRVPKVLGLTATIIKGQSKMDKIPWDVSDIEKRLCCKAVTHRNYEEVLKNSTSNIVKIIPYITNYKMAKDAVCQDVVQFVELLEKLPRDFGLKDEVSIIDRINHPSLTSEEQIYNKDKGVPKTLKSFLMDLLKTYEELGPYCCKLATTLKIVYVVQQIQGLDFQTNNGKDSEDTEQIHDQEPSILMLLESAKTILFQFMKKLDTVMDQEAKQGARHKKVSVEAYKLRYCVSKKVEEVWKILEGKRPTGDAEIDKENQLCGIIFCQRRITAQVMRWYLEEAAKNWPDNLGFIKPEVMIGHSTIVGDTELARFTAKMQTQIVSKFHKRELNLLVATQVVEEGLNVPACNLVVRLDSITSYPSFIQSLGRARKKGAYCYALIDVEEQGKEVAKIQGYHNYSKELSKTLAEKAAHVGDEEDGVDVELQVDMIPPFNPSGDPNGPMITATDAVSLVHRYCNALSCDKIAALFPTAWYEDQFSEKDKKKYFKARVLLPIMSPIRDVVEGDWMPDKTVAKRAAYLKCCKLLWAAGELTENLLPKPRSIESFKCQFLDDLKVQLEEEKKTASFKIGTKKRTQWYRKKAPSIFATALPINPDIVPSVYKIRIKMTKYVADNSYRNLYNFDQYGQYFAIITNAKLEGLQKFTLNASYGAFEVSIQKCKLSIQTLSNDEIELLEDFQGFLRRSIFNTINSVLKSDPQPSILIAPLTQDLISKTYEIDWQLVQCLLNLDEEEHLLSPPSIQWRKDMKFYPKNYENKVLIPWYKDDAKEKPEYLCSLSVMDVDAQSPFDDQSKARTFEDYYVKKYHTIDSVFHPEFPLIFCKDIGKQLNFLTKKVDSYELRKEKQSKNMLRMIPELMNIHILPASLYIQGKFLPSILHRVYRLLLANEFRLSVAEYFKWNVTSGEDEILDSDEDDDEDDGDDSESIEAAMKRMQMNTVVQESSLPVKEKETKKKRKIILLESINPFTVDWEMILKPNDSPERKRNSVRDSKYALPEPPTYKSDACSNLVDIDKVKSYDFDKETNFFVERGPSMDKLMEAFTLSNAQDNVSLEKLEVMGDSVLKLVVSLHIFSAYPRWDEGKMTQLRMQLICNLHMYQLGRVHDLGGILSGSIFIPDKSWLPTGCTIPQNVADFVLSKRVDYDELKSLSESDLQNNEILERHVQQLRASPSPRSASNVNLPHTTYTHSQIGDKSVADCMEAIIGAYYVNGGIDGAFRIMDFLGMRGPLEDGSATKYSRKTTMSPVKSEYYAKLHKQNIIPMLQDLEQILQYKFKNPWLAVESLTHPTFMSNRITPCYERLEYVGDAILDFVVTNYILKETGLTDPGKITDLRAALVNNVTFASLAVRYEFHKFLQYHSEPLKHFIDQFVAYQEDNGHKVSDPCKLLSDYDCPTVQEIDVPKVLGDVFESLAGAVFVDSGMSIDTVWKVFFRLMKNELEEFSKCIPKSPLRELYEQFPGKVKFIKPSSADKDSNNANPNSKKSTQSPRYQVVYLKVPSCNTLVRGVGTTTKQAKQAAAKYLVRKIKFPELSKV